MNLHLGGIRDYAQSCILVEHFDPVGTLTIDDMRKKKEHNQAMLEIASALSYAEFDDIKGLDSAKKMWDALDNIYGGDKNVQRAKSKSLRGKFDDMKMLEGETFAQYVARIKEVVSSIKGATGQIDDDIVLIKVLRTLLPVYAIRVSAIQELRCILGNDLTLEGLVGRLTNFDLSNLDNYKPENIESAFKAKLTLKESREKRQMKKIGKVKYVSSDSNTDEEDIE